jgi:hypothetical protein
VAQTSESKPLSRHVASAITGNCTKLRLCSFWQILAALLTLIWSPGYTCIPVQEANFRLDVSPFRWYYSGNAPSNPGRMPMISNPSIAEVNAGAQADPLHSLALLRVTTKRPEELEEYLADHADLAAAIDDVCSAVRAAFGAEAELALELYNDPEVDDRYVTLYVRQHQYLPDFMDWIESVADPFRAHLDSLSGHLLITTDFRRPRG